MQLKSLLFVFLSSAAKCSGVHLSSRLAFIPRGGLLINRVKSAEMSAPPPAIKDQVASSSSIPTENKKKRKLERFAEKIFDEADENKDGSISFSEAYTLVLKMYVQLNRQAPIPPPSKKKVLQLYMDSDLSNDNSLNREEFSHLAGLVIRRALWRVSAHKLCKMVGAPLLTEFLIRKLGGNAWLQRLAARIVPSRFQERVLPILFSSSFWRPLLLLIFVVSLGNVVLNIVNWILDMSLPDEENDPRLAGYKDL